MDYKNQNYQQPVYQQPVYVQDDSQIVSTSDWFWSMLLMCIPVVNIIMIFIWAFGSNKKSKANYGKALLIWWLVSIGISIIITIVVIIICLITGVGFAGLMSTAAQYSGY